jgi:hypothetical protein
MSIVYADVRLGNDARPELEEINATALVETGALHLCIPEHVALQLRLSQSSPARSRRPTEDPTWFPMSVPSRSLYWDGNA